MKTRTRALEARFYVVRLSHEEWDLPESEKRKLIAERSGGRPVMVSAEKCDTVEEWVKRYAPH